MDLRLGYKSQQHSLSADICDSGQLSSAPGAAEKYVLKDKCFYIYLPDKNIPISYHVELWNNQDHPVLVNSTLRMYNSMYLKSLGENKIIIGSKQLFKATLVYDSWSVTIN
jgi:hypothetical protein